MTYACHEVKVEGGHYMSCTPSYEAMAVELMPRAAVDLKCPEPSLRVVSTSAWVEIEGCNAHAIYRLQQGKEDDWAVMIVPMPPATAPGATDTAPAAASLTPGPAAAP
jgi:hypothetical protein